MGSTLRDGYSWKKNTPSRWVFLEDGYSWEMSNSGKWVILIWKMGTCKTVNLVNTLGWSRDAQRERKKLRDTSCADTTDFWGSEEVALRQNCEEVFNQLNSTNWVKLHKGHVQGSWGEVTCRGEFTWRRHASCPGWYAFTNGWSYNSADFSNET